MPVAAQLVAQEAVVARGAAGHQQHARAGVDDLDFRGAAIVVAVLVVGRRDDAGFELQAADRRGLEFELDFDRLGVARRTSPRLRRLRTAAASGVASRA